MKRVELMEHEQQAYEVIQVVATDHAIQFRNTLCRLHDEQEYQFFPRHLTQVLVIETLDKKLYPPLKTSYTS